MVFTRSICILLVASLLSIVLTSDAATGCKYNNGVACPMESPCCSAHGHCGNSALSCGTGCDASASFNGVCQRYNYGAPGNNSGKDGNSAANGSKPVPSLPKGSFKIVGHSGVTAQHIALVTPNKMIIIDRTENNTAKLPDGRAAHAAEYDLTTNTIRVLDVKTNTFCSGGGFLPNGTLISAGGAEATTSHAYSATIGFQSLRMYQPCDDNTCEFIENPADPNWQLTGNRWYVSVTTLPSGDLFILGGSNESLAINREATNNPTWEIYPRPADFKPVFLQFMVDAMPNNLYPNVYTLPDGTLYIFANQKSMIYNVTSREEIKRLPDIPGGPRSYPLTASNVLLPLDPAKNYAHEILVCGGTEVMSSRSNALKTCGRINLHADDPQWEMEDMPAPRLMSDAVILADGKIMLLNGAQVGFAGFGQASNPVYTPIVYDPDAPVGQRITEWVPSNIARMYHSVATLLPDGSVFVTGSNPNKKVETENVVFPTEFRVESFTPPYLTTDLERPEILGDMPEKLTYGQTVEFTIDVKATSKYQPDITFMLGHRGFVTHSTHMSQRMTKLVINKVKDEGTQITYSVTMPPNANIMPPGPHYIHVLNNGVPSIARHTVLGKKNTLNPKL